MTQMVSNTHRNYERSYLNREHARRTLKDNSLKVYSLLNSGEKMGTTMTNFGEHYAETTQNLQLNSINFGTSLSATKFRIILFRTIYKNLSLQNYSAKTIKRTEKIECLRTCILSSKSNVIFFSSRTHKTKTKKIGE